MPRQGLQVNRNLTGGVALFFLIAGVFSAVITEGESLLAAGLVRNGLLLGALWLALPSNNRPAAWADVSWSTILLAILVAIGFLSARFRWTTIPLVLGVCIAVYLLKRAAKPRN